MPDNKQEKNKEIFDGPFSWIGFNYVKTVEPLGESLLLTTKYQRVLKTHLITSNGWNAKSTLEAPRGFEHGTRGFG